MKSRTAVIAKPIDRHGGLYQRRAVAALPLLVRQAHAGHTIYYSDLAAELGMPNPRNLNFVLGSIGTSLNSLAAQWGSKVPPLQALVVNQEDEMPGEGFGYSIPDPKILENVSKHTRKSIVDGLLAEVYGYSRWFDVLRHFDIDPPQPSVQSDLLQRAGHFRGAGGESEAHLQLKHFIAANPKVVGVTQRVLRTVEEYRLPSGDEVDVVFVLRRTLVGVEVKSAYSPEADVVRGVFQCIKYDALLNAEAQAQGRKSDIHVVLGLGGSSSAVVRRLANTLGVTVIDEIEPCTS